MNTHEQIWPWDVLDKKIKKARSHVKPQTEQIGVVQRCRARFLGIKWRAAGRAHPTQKTVSSSDARWVSFEGLAKQKKAVAGQGLTLCHFSHPRVCKLVFGCLLFAVGLWFHEKITGKPQNM